MRIIIKGKITAERLAESFNKALETIKETHPDLEGVYGANLYINIYDKEAEPIELLYANGKEVILAYESPDGKNSLIMTEEMKAKKKEKEEKLAQQQKIEKEEKAARAKAYKEQMDKDQAIRNALTKESLDKVKAINDPLIDLTNTLIRTKPKEFIEGLTNIITHIWETDPPLYNNKNKDVRMQPSFYILNSTLYLRTTMSTNKKIANPLYWIESKADWKTGATEYILRDNLSYAGWDNSKLLTEIKNFMIMLSATTL